MVKVRGHRIELGDIEAVLETHPAVREVAVAVIGEGMAARLKAYVAGEKPPTLLDLKRHCAERLPRYMIVDELAVVGSLPRTRNGKVDRLSLLVTGAA
jgi:clorobiocin biosynthesis protein CloN4